MNQSELEGKIFNRYQARENIQLVLSAGKHVTLQYDWQENYVKIGKQPNLREQILLLVSLEAGRLRRQNLCSDWLRRQVLCPDWLRRQELCPDWLRRQDLCPDWLRRQDLCSDWLQQVACWSSKRKKEQLINLVFTNLVVFVWSLGFSPSWRNGKQKPLSHHWSLNLPDNPEN